MRRRLAVALALTTALAVGGCSRDSAHVEVGAQVEASAPSASSAPETSASTAAVPPAPSAAGSVDAAPGSSATAPLPLLPSHTATPGSSTKLLDPGVPPRRKLRYTWHLDQKEQLVMDLRTSAATEVAGQKQPEIPLPPVHIVLDLEPRSVTPEGDLHYSWHVSAAEVTSDPQTPASIADGMRVEVSAIDHLAGSAVVTARGLCTGIAVDTAAALDAGATGQMVEQVRQTLRDVAAPMPEEEVGRGARWQKITQLDAKGSRLTQTDTFTLAALPGEPGQGATGTVDDVLAQTAPPQLLRTPGMSAGTEARMESMLASGDSKTRFDLARLVPQTRFTGTTTMIVSGQASGDATKRVTMVMRVGIDIQGRPR